MTPRVPVLFALCGSLACATSSVQQGDPPTTGDANEVLDAAPTPEGDRDPDPEQARDSSRGTDDPQGEALAPLGARNPVEAPAPGSCPASKIPEVRYGSTVPAQVKLPAKLAKLRCVEDVNQKLEADLACAKDFNEAAWGHALYAEGLELLERQERWVRWRGRAQLQIGEVYDDPDQQGQQLVYIGEFGSDCSGSSILTDVGPGLSLARNHDGELLVVVPKPTVEARSYARCSCFPGCGAYMQPEPHFLIVPQGGQISGRVELEYPAISISTHAVESESCCCAP